MNSNLGSVVPLAMFTIKIGTLCFPFSGCEVEPRIHSSTSLFCPEGFPGSGNHWCHTFPAYNILSLDVDRWSGNPRETANYWLAENGKKGKDQGFILDLGCIRTVQGVRLRNVRNPENLDRSTKKFQLLGSASNNGPWEGLLVANLEDSRPQDPPPVLTLTFDKPSVARFVKFELLDFWGTEGGGLQYLEVLPDF